MLGLSVAALFLMKLLKNNAEVVGSGIVLYTYSQNQCRRYLFKHCFRLKNKKIMPRRVVAALYLAKLPKNNAEVVGSDIVTNNYCKNQCRIKKSRLG